MKSIVFIHQDQPDLNGEQVDIEGLTVPESVPLRLGFDGPEIGKAYLKREGNKIMADIHGIQALGKELYPAIGFIAAEGSLDGTVSSSRKGTIFEVALCQENADPRIPALGALEPDWTVDPKTGRSNSSEPFNDICYAVDRLIRDSAHDLINGNVDCVARLIVAQLAHKHGMSPKGVSIG